MFHQTRIHLMMIGLIAGTIFFAKLGDAPLWDRDEPRNAGCAAEMIANDTLTVPVFNGELRHQKPVLLYWLMISAYSVFGVTEFSARFWSAALAVATVLLTYGIASRWTNSRVAFLSAIILATNVMFTVAARAATPDSLLVFCTVLSFWIYSIGILHPSCQNRDHLQLRNAGHWFPQNRWYVLGMYGAMSLGVLAKGPIGFLIPTAVIGLFLLVKRSESVQPLRPQSPGANLVDWLRPFSPKHFLGTCWYMRLWLAVVALGLIAVPWYAMVGWQTNGEFLRKFLIGENFSRAAGVLENHSGGFWYYPVAILVGFFPWSVFWPAVLVGLIGLFRNSQVSANPLLVFSLCWVTVQVGLFTIAQTKLPSYVTPCYPALAIVTASCIHGCLDHSWKVSSVWIRVSLGGLILSGVGISILMFVLIHRYLPGSEWIVATGLLPVMGGLFALFQIRKNLVASLPVTLGITAVLFCFALIPVATSVVGSTQQNKNVLNLIRDSAPNQKVASYGVIESSWVFYGQHSIEELDLKPLSRRNPAVKSQSARLFWQTRDRLNPEQLLVHYPDAMFVTTDQHLDNLKARLPADYTVVESARYFLKDERILLLARTDSETANLVREKNGYNLSRIGATNQSDLK